MNSRWILSCEKKMFSKKKKSTNLAGQRPWTWVIGGSSKEREQRWQSLKVIGSVPTMTEGLYPEELMSPNAVIKIYGFRGALHENLTHRPSHRPVSTKSQSYHWTAALQESELLSPICSLKTPWSQTIVIKVLHNAPNKWAVWVDEGEETDQKVAVGQWTTKKRRNALLSFINPFIFCDTKPASIFFPVEPKRPVPPFEIWFGDHSSPQSKRLWTLRGRWNRTSYLHTETQSVISRR